MSGHPEDGLKPSDAERFREVFTREELADLSAAAAASGHQSLREYLIALHQKNRRFERFPGPLPNGLVSALSTDLGRILQGNSLRLLYEELDPQSVDLILTSPPFGLLRKKSYGNVGADEYLEWFRPFALGFRRVLKPTGSLIIDIGGSWNSKIPTRNLYNFRLLLMLCDEYGFHLAQDFYWWNPSRLPTPAVWVTVRRIRVKEAVNTIWWLSPTPWPKASNSRVLNPYSEAMLELFRSGYSRHPRPSGHRISKSFGRVNGGAIPPNLLAVANTDSTSYYQKYCADNKLPVHPARFPDRLPEFFIRMLTDEGDLVVDPFAGSCVTGAVSERLRRKWICCELEEDYVRGAVGRFTGTHGTRVDSAQPYRILPPCTVPYSAGRDLRPLDGGQIRANDKS